VTGWNFESNASERPVTEDCHYAEHAGVNKVDPGERGAGWPSDSAPECQVDLAGVLASWSSGMTIT
jgi:hypothetical protein